MFVTTIGSLLYTQVLVHNSQFLLIASQLLLGVGSGTLGVTRGYVAHVSHKSVRTKFIAWVTALQYAGFTMMPFAGSFLIDYFSKMKPESTTSLSMKFLQINQYNSPGILISILAFVGILLLLYVFVDIHFDSKKNDAKNANEIRVQQTPYLRASPVDLAVLSCMMLNVTTKGSIATLETLGVEIAVDAFHLTPSIAGNIVAVNGCLGVMVLFLYGYWSVLLSEAQVIVSGIIVMMMGFISIICFGKLDVIRTGDNCYSFSMFMIYAVGYPLGHTAAMALFSKRK